MLTYILGHIDAAENANRNLKTVLQWSAQHELGYFLNAWLYVTQLHAHRHAQFKKSLQWHNRTTQIFEI